DEAVLHTAEPRLRARGEHVRGAIEGLCGRPDTGYAILLAGAEPVAALDPGQAARMLTEAGRLAWTAADLSKVAEAGRRLAVLPPVEDTAAAGARLMVGLAALLAGDPGRAARPLREGHALAQETAQAKTGEAAGPLNLWTAAGAAMFLGADAEALDLFTAAAVRARGSGAVSALPLLLAPLGSLQMWTGRLAAARATATEGLRLALDTRQDNTAAHHRSVLAWIAAVRGQSEECRTEAEAALAQSIGQRLGPSAGIAAWALALLDLGQGRTAQACDRLSAMADAAPGEGHPIVKIFAAADLVEAAVRTGRPERANAALDLLRSWAGPVRSPWAHALVARCRGLVEEDAVEARFTEALSLHAEAGRPFDTARTALLFGEALRRRRRRAEARRHLRAACEAFERLDAAPWAELARVELQATGESARKRDPSTVADLTPQESQIARLVSEGGTNREIAAHLFLSPRTVDYHLHKVFVKLGLSSRAELVRLSLEHPDALGGAR
ncbi:LuxR C-terminal-related transcriptional regulator, partial [Nonomuraea antimicrobica]|uniref:LuxR C-terminal-related transcriptional regulator n=1 Tax=Nonomuraea antimicrobica TaxID=561173 RepID=UPI0031E84D13